jgi:hypothetical protein
MLFVRLPWLYAVETDTPLSAAIPGGFLSYCPCFQPGFGYEPGKRCADFQKLQQILPDTPAFHACLEKTGEVTRISDFVPRSRARPDPLHFLEWPAGPYAGGSEAPARGRSSSLFEKYDLGTSRPLSALIEDGPSPRQSTRSATPSARLPVRMRRRSILASKA